MTEPRENENRGMDIQAWSPQSLKHLGVTPGSCSGLWNVVGVELNNCIVMGFVPLGQQFRGVDSISYIPRRTESNPTPLSSPQDSTSRVLIYIGGRSLLLHLSAHHCGLRHTSPAQCLPLGLVESQNAYSYLVLSFVFLSLGSMMRCQNANQVKTSKKLYTDQGKDKTLK